MKQNYLPDLDPGDVYSYFQRRKVDPFFYTKNKNEITFLCGDRSLRGETMVKVFRVFRVYRVFRVFRVFRVSTHGMVTHPSTNGFEHW